ncbi:FAD-dependent thymidylate synthase [candidate division KSB1 bacterium]|nr:FAD-dependent thymidylate synthase [candidate division KSB1 bacterium]
MRVRLVQYTQDPLKVVFTAARTCYSETTPIAISEGQYDKDKMMALVKKTFRAGHHSIFEHVCFTFAIEGISRVCSHQLVRHRIASYSQQSQRFVEYSRPQYVVPPKVKGDYEKREKFDKLMGQLFDTYREFVQDGIPPEDARYLFPNALKTNLVMSMNLRELFHASGERLCLNAQWEIIQLFTLIKREVRKAAPFFARFLEPKCEHIGYCPELKYCGKKIKNLLVPGVVHRK